MKRPTVTIRQVKEAIEVAGAVLAAVAVVVKAIEGIKKDGGEKNA